jgi:hypothetical protein
MTGILMVYIHYTNMAILYQSFFILQKFNVFCVFTNYLIPVFNVECFPYKSPENLLYLVSQIILGYRAEHEMK